MYISKIGKFTFQKLRESKILKIWKKYFLLLEILDTIRKLRTIHYKNHICFEKKKNVSQKLKQKFRKNWKLTSIRKRVKLNFPPKKQKKNYYHLRPRSEVADWKKCEKSVIL